MVEELKFAVIEGGKTFADIGLGFTFILVEEGRGLNECKVCVRPGHPMAPLNAIMLDDMRFICVTDDAPVASVSGGIVTIGNKEVE